MSTLEDLIKEEHDEVRSWKLESDGLYTEGNERVIPFNEEIVERALRVAVKMSNEEKIPKQEVFFKQKGVESAFEAIMEALWKVGHPNAVNPQYVEDFEVEEDGWPKNWKVVYEKAGNSTDIAKI